MLHLKDYFQKHPRLINSILAFALGALASLSMAPYNIWVCALIGLAGLYVLLMRVSSTRQAALYGFIFSYGYFVLSLSWVGNALLVDGNPYVWAYPLALLGAPILLAWVLGVAAFLLKKLDLAHHLTGLCSSNTKTPLFKKDITDG